MNFYEGKKVFIAGGAGLIGQALIRALVPLGAKVAATEYRARKIEPIWRAQIEVIENCDLTGWGSNAPDVAYDNQDIVFWVAAKVGGAASIRSDPMGLVHYNLELSSRNIKAAVDAGVSRFCYVSSSYVYPEMDTPNIEKDTDHLDVPFQHYGLGWIKRFMEKLCMAHQMTSKTRFALVRPTAAYGPHDNFDLETCHVVPALVRKVAEGQNPLEVWGDGSEQRQFTYVDDLAQGLLLATEHYAFAEPINIATPQVSSVRDVARCLLELAGERAPLAWQRPMDPELSYVGGIKYLGDKPKVISRRVVSMGLCWRRLGYECETALADGLRKTLEWYKAARA